MKPQYDKINKNNEAKHFIKKVLALAFLPPELIVDEYFVLKNEASNAIKVFLRTFFQYYERYWLRTITPPGFSVYGLSRQTNNISESFKVVLHVKIFKNSNFFY